MRLDSMKKTTYILLYVFAIVLTACTEVIVAQPADTLYSEKMVMSIYGRQPELSVERICQASGFANADTFTRNFKAKYGLTPTAYRTTLG